MTPTNYCPRCSARAVVRSRAEEICLACGHELKDLPMWLATTPSEPLAFAPPERLSPRFDDDDEERLAR